MEETVPTVAGPMRTLSPPTRPLAFWKLARSVYVDPLVKMTYATTTIASTSPPTAATRATRTPRDGPPPSGEPPPRDEPPPPEDPPPGRPRPGAEGPRGGPPVVLPNGLMWLSSFALPELRHTSGDGHPAKANGRAPLSAAPARGKITC